MAENDNRGDIDAISSQGSDELLYNVIFDEFGNDSDSHTSGESAFITTTDLVEWNRSLDDRVRTLSLEQSMLHKKIDSLEKNMARAAELAKAKLRVKDLVIEELSEALLDLRVEVDQIKAKATPGHNRNINQ